MSATFPRSIDPRLLDQLPTLPGTAVEFLRLCDDPTSGVKDVAQVAQRDPAGIGPDPAGGEFAVLFTA